MASKTQLEIEQKLATLQAEFETALPAKFTEIKSFWDDSLQSEELNDSVIKNCYLLAHSMIGSSGTFGAATICDLFRELADSFKLLLKDKNLFLELAPKISELFKKLNTNVINWQPEKIPYVMPLKNETDGADNLVYLVEEDELLAEDLIVKLEQHGYIVNAYSDLTTFVSAFSVKKPDAIILDVLYKDGGIEGGDTLTRLKKGHETFPPVVFVSSRNDMEARLISAKSGAQRYFCKPVNATKLSKTLNGLIEHTIREPYRILLVDDDVAALDYYEAILTGAGLKVKTLANPMDSLDALAEFNPDVIVLDIHMPECSGPEVAQVIRQNDRWAITPILFLSTETDLDIQLDALNLGGESFLLKPVTAEHFISIVTAKAKMARWTYQINNDLETALRESEFQLTTSNQHDIVSTADVTGRITSVNEKFCEISGFNREELIGQNHRLLKSNQHPDSFYEDMWQTISSGKIWHGLICNYTKNREEYWVESTIVPFLDEKGKPYKYVSARTDVTQVIQSEARLERSQKFANIGTWDWNIKTGNLFWSERIWPLFGYDKEVTETTYDNFIAAIHPDDRQRVIDAINNCLENEAEYNLEHRVVWPDNSVRWLHESGNVTRDINNKPQHMLGVVQDITERKMAEYALIEARKEAEDANRAKSQFLSSMSHELRTPMNAIMGFGQLLTLDVLSPLNENQSENVNEILKASDHLLELINEVLDLAKIEAGRIDLSIEDVILADVITESLQLILPLAEKRGITISLYKEETEVSINDLSDLQNIVRADYTRMKQVLINFLSNAVKYNSENGEIKINCSKSDENLRISVSDTGAGLTPEQQEQLFTAFNRLGAENTEIEGTGIGLVISQNIIDLMGGDIGLKSEAGVGSTFWFELPGSSVTNSKDDHGRSSTDINVVLETKRSVLYIEDNPANLRLVSQLLGRLPNLHMWTAHEPLLGLELAEEHKPDLILLDINLPGIDGFEVLKLLRQRNATKNTPVIAISANAMPRDIQNGMEAGFDEYITKPININSLLLAVDERLNE